HAIVARLNSTCSRTCQSSARDTSRFANCATELTSPAGLGFTVPIAATLASAASRACNNGVRSATGASPGAAPPGCRALTCARISSTAAASSLAFSSAPSFTLGCTLLAPACGDLRIHAAARGELAHHRGRYRIACLYDIAQKAIHDILLENAEVAVF